MSDYPCDDLEFDEEGNSDDPNFDPSPDWPGALRAIVDGDGAILGRYIREAKEPDPSVISALVEPDPLLGGECEEDPNDSKNWHSALQAISDGDDALLGRYIRGDQKLQRFFHALVLLLAPIDPLLDNESDDNDPNFNPSPDWHAALQAISDGDGAILGRHIRETQELDPRVLRALVLLLDPSSTYYWQLTVQYRRNGRPTAKAREWKSAVSKALAPLATTILVNKKIDHPLRQALGRMLDPSSNHPLLLSFEERPVRGRPPIQSIFKWRRQWPSNLRFEHDSASALRLGAALGTPLKQIVFSLEDRMSRASVYRHRKKHGLARRAKKAVPLLQAAGEPKGQD